MMRNEVLHGYMIHHRKYREKAILCISSLKNMGGLMVFKTDSASSISANPVLQATGKSELKNFTKLEILNQPVFFLAMLFCRVLFKRNCS